MRRHNAFGMPAAAAVSAALILYYCLSGDIPWYGWFTISTSAAVIAFVSATALAGLAEKRRDRAYSRGRIRESIHRAEAVFRDVSALSNDYDFMDEGEASQRIASYARQNAATIRECRDEIREEIRHMGGRDSASRGLDGVLDDLRWFGTFYGCDGPEPSVGQRVAWNEGRDRIDGRLDRLSRAARMLAGA